MKALRLALWCAWPILVLYGLEILEPRYIGGLLVLALLVRYRRTLARVATTASRLEYCGIAAAVGMGATVIIANNEALLRLYPALVNLGFLLVFGASLLHSQSMVERFALASEPQLSEAGRRYARAVTQVWCGVFVVNGAIAAWTALRASREIWAIYNGFIAYVLIGAVFGIEFLCRRYWRARHV